ncbi:hypothetical protein ASF60_19895 [Methylobacterium sp. Leaf113]|uniref:hypothetical protein n=1 Tax=Methylobacterium sp. Leaf113 TaxID=1736259 RepID=UPI0006FCE6FC|nr:hypothetical protein [Methylobacterium sp. Leaf113]KQP89007.1 hypothetical protein ASF60_19895 [Methylobacterium sp. Leaf113]
MIGPAEIEDMRLDLVAFQEQAMLYDVALAPLHRHWARRGGPSVGAVKRICDLVFAKAADRSVSDWKAVASEAVEEAGYSVLWDGDEVALLKARLRLS